eukprot:6430050-Prymnesium_polylepis.1
MPPAKKTLALKAEPLLLSGATQTLVNFAKQLQQKVAQEDEADALSGVCPSQIEALAGAVTE